MDINELLGLEGEALAQHLASLNGEQLAEAETALIAAADEITDNTPESVAKLVKISEVVTATRNAYVEFEAQQAAAEQAAVEARAAIAGEAAEEDSEAPAEGPEAPADPETPENPEAAADAALEPALAASTRRPGRINRMARNAGRATPSPEQRDPNAPGRATLVASSALQQAISLPNGIENQEQLAEGMAEMLNGMNPGDAPRGKVLVASMRWNLPDDRQLKNNDPGHNERVFAGKLGRRAFLSLPEVITASGGVCAPVNVDYSVPGWSTADRPLRDALPAFQAERGGLSYVPPSDISAYAGATTVWTEATDANPAGATKPVAQVICGTQTTAYVNAIPTRLGFGNMTARFAPEQTAAAIDLAMSAAARTAEIELLQLIAAACVANVTTTAVLGATRDLLTTIYQIVAGYRSFHRIPDDVKFTGVFPFWLKDLLKVDLVREIGHSQNEYFDALRIKDEDIDALLMNAGVNPVWHLDGQSSSQLSGAGGVGQVLAGQAASSVVNPFPTKVVWYFFPEGAFQFLDGGRLDLGVVRDSTLDATNDYETFVEPFEGLAFRGFATGALQLVSSLCANGETSGTVSVGSCA